ncbi:MULTISPECIES: cobalt-precorrin-5B (C(1))-methyltransferase CbiD [unclassified Moorena]|uniref:cobalt-precorrin-5B (C(1))-methyltransferase CbiD n=1 Tax=unclassified Moorena TaxID=2683338 RepID=UPI0013C1296F|nr:MULTISPECIES: cobalt-precorrin-5B (C(1))-methyltransferase CbiD [unclassified Moorena]NEO04540.1 cobalt-precorrin-5B (C(1))-methyltransferase [Moorena sp. SIO3I8]NEP26767.1 cobalt-precorrin-5B (C(1))-methyltransferase [Moorena sp. SIO3I6]NEQ56378.1 cobalt-precorrin-5B (C(1))-methyltransferase [Moorena sp. SIO4A1]
MTTSLPKSGYTLPVFACASAIAALHKLRNDQPVETVSVDLINPPETVDIPIEQVARIREGVALAITHSNPGDNLDLTRNTPIWAVVEWGSSEQTKSIQLLGGEGIGRQINAGGKPAIYAYAKKLLHHNLSCLLVAPEKIQVTIILPEGRKLAQRTSNSAFGVVEGLSLLGTTGISQPLSAPGQLAAYQEELKAKASKLLKEQSSSHSSTLVFCVGENGLDLARGLGINPERLVKTANWLGPLLVAAGYCQVPEILLFGYHGKLIKLAGGIFHTHHHLADGRLEIITAHCAQLGVPTPLIRQVFGSQTTEAALNCLRQWDQTQGTDWVNQVYHAIALTIDQRCFDYIRKHSEHHIQVGSVLFDRDRKIIVTSPTGCTLISNL